MDARELVGLVEPNPLNSIAVIKPASWGQRGYDLVTQTFRWTMYDESGQPLDMEIRFDDLSEPAIRYFETAKSMDGNVLVGQVVRTARGHLFHPYSIHHPDGTSVNPALDLAQSTACQGTGGESNADDENEGENAPEGEIDFHSPAGRILLDLENTLLSAAEAGTGSVSPLVFAKMEQLAAEAETVNLTVLATAIRKAVHDRDKAEAFLCGRYVSHVHYQALSRT